MSMENAFRNLRGQRVVMNIGTAVPIKGKIHTVSKDTAVVITHADRNGMDVQSTIALVHVRLVSPDR